MVPKLLRCLARSHIQVAGDVLQQLQHGGHLPLGEQIDLEVQLTALVGLASQPILAREHEQCEEDSLERNGHRQEREWEGIERARRIPSPTP